MKWFVYVFLAVFLTGCSKSFIQEMSIDEARALTLNFQTSSFSPPKRGITDIKKAYDLEKLLLEIPSPEQCRKQEEREVQLKEVYEEMKTSPSSLTQLSAFAVRLSDREFARGDYQQTIKTLERIYNLLPNSGYKVRQGFLASQLSKIYAELGQKSKTYFWRAKASDVWYQSGWSGDDKVKMVEAYHEANIERLNANLPAEEYYLRQTHVLRKRVGEQAFHPLDLYILQAKLVKNLLLQGRLIEAESLAREYILDIYEGNKEMLFTPLAQVLYEQNRLEDAAYVARVAIALHQKKCSSADGIALSLARKTLLNILLAQNAFFEVKELLSKAKQSLSKKRFKELYGSSKEVLLARLFTQDTEGLQAHFTTMQDDVELRLMKVLLQKKFLSTKAFYTLYKPLEEKALASGAWQEAQRFRLFQSLLIEHVREQENRAELLYVLTNNTQHSSVQKALNASALRASIKDKRLQKLVRQEQNTLEQIKASSQKLAFYQVSRPKEVSFQSLQTMQERIYKLRGARKALLTQIQKEFPKYASLMQPKQVSLQSLQKRLRATQALLLMRHAKNRHFVWFVPAKGKIHFHESSLTTAQLRKELGLVRASLEPQGNSVESIAPFALKSAHRLYEALLKPLEKDLNKVDTLLVVKQGVLSQLPLALLPRALPSDVSEKSVRLNVHFRGLKKAEQKRFSAKESESLFAMYKRVPWLINTHAIAYLPSTQALLKEANLHNKPSKSLAAFANPLFNAQQQKSVVDGFLLRSTPKTHLQESSSLKDLPALPETALEVASIAKRLGALKEDLFLGVRASEENVKNMDLTPFKVLVFATHGLLPRDLDGLTQPALALSSPKLTKGNEDGLLTMGEILGLSLNANWLILSACNTAQGDDNEVIAGLGRAFFYAGVRAMLVTHWPVESQSAKLLTTAIFEHTDKTKAQALRLAQLSLLHEKSVKNTEGKELYTYAHPIFWAPFVLVGK